MRFGAKIFIKKKKNFHGLIWIFIRQFVGTNLKLVRKVRTCVSAACVFLKTSGIQAGDLWTGRSHWKDYFR